VIALIAFCASVLLPLALKLLVRHNAPFDRTADFSVALKESANKGRMLGIIEISPKGHRLSRSYG
jgi:hypothetical protein